jgi:hypothetical protein
MRMRLNWYSEQIWSRLALAIIVGLVAVALCLFVNTVDS